MSTGILQGGWRDEENARRMWQLGSESVEIPFLLENHSTLTHTGLSPTKMLMSGLPLWKHRVYHGTHTKLRSFVLIGNGQVRRRYSIFTKIGRAKCCSWYSWYGMMMEKLLINCVILSWQELIEKWSHFYHKYSYITHAVAFHVTTFLTIGKYSHFLHSSSVDFQSISTKKRMSLLFFLVKICIKR